MSEKRRGKRRIILIVLAVLAVCAVILHLPVPPPTLRIGPETTVLDGPVREDGTIDYALALDTEAGKGVTPENNAAIPLLRVFGPKTIEDPAVRAEALRKLGLSSLPEDGDYFVSLEDWTEKNLPKPKRPSIEEMMAAFEAGKELAAPPEPPLDYDGLSKQLNEAMAAPWPPSKHPELARWLAENDRALDRLAAATRRKRYYLPVLGDPPGMLMIKGMRGSPGPCVEGARALICRAMARARAGQTDRAWQGTLATHRLSRLIAQDPMIVFQLAAAGIEALAAQAGAALATSGDLSRDQALAMLADLEALPPLPLMVNALDGPERFVALDAMVLVTQGMPIDQIQGPPARRGRPRSLDPNEMTRVANRWFDGMVDALQQPTHAERGRAYEAWRDDSRGTLVRAKSPTGIARRGLLVAGGLACRKARSRMVATLLMGILGPSLGRAVDLQVRALQQTDLTRLCLAMAAAKAETGEWPKTLDELVPKYLKQVPLDRFTGKALVYQPRDGGFVLYSLGENMTDDKGLTRRRTGPGYSDDVAVWAGITPPEPQPDPDLQPLDLGEDPASQPGPIGPGPVE